MKQLFSALAAMAMLPSALLASGVKTEVVGPHDAMIRVSPSSGRSLLIPVEEASEDAEIRVLRDGLPDRIIYVRPARNKIDYYVPFDMSEYADSDSLLLYMRTPGNMPISADRVMSVPLWRGFKVSDTFDTTDREKFRPAFHHTPLYGWMNDPNGMFYKDGEWHLYYQWNPYGSKWQNMTWGHASSPDLINWTSHGAAISPDGLGSIFSGSSAVDRGNSLGLGPDAVAAMYTSAGPTQQQSLAVSTDSGRTFAKFAGNPVLTLPSEARDPNMFWNADTRSWTLVLAHPLEHEMLFFTSPDLKTWTATGEFGKGLGAQQGVWECPDLFPLEIEGKRKWVLICNINPGGPFGGSGTQYFIGDFDGRTFRSDLDASGNVPTKWMDYGKDNYAGVSFSDAPGGRRTLIGWMSNWQYADRVPTMQFRSANTLPRDLRLFRDSEGEIRLASEPSPETDALRTSLAARAGKVTVGGKGKMFSLPALCEISLDLAPGHASEVTLALSNEEGDKVDIVYDASARTLSMDRTQSGITDFSAEFPGVTAAPVFSDGKLVSLRIFIDRSSIEIFGDKGNFAMTNLVFPESPYSLLTLSAKGGNAEIKNLNIYKLK